MTGYIPSVFIGITLGLFYIKSSASAIGRILTESCIAKDIKFKKAQASTIK